VRSILCPRNRVRYNFRSFQVQIRELERDLAKLDGELAQSMRAFREAMDLQKQVDTVKAEIAKLDLALKNPVFEEFTGLEAKDVAFRQQTEALRALRQRVTQFQSDSQRFDTPALPPALKEDAALRRTRDRAFEARTALDRHIDELTRELDQAAVKADEEYRKWLPDFQAVKKKYEAAIQEGGGDYKALAQQRARKVKDQEDLGRRLEKANEQAAALKDTGARRKAALEQLRSAYAAYTEERKTRCGRIETEAAGRLKIRIHEASNLEEFRQRLAALKRGSYLRDSDIEKLCGKIDPGLFMRAVITYSLLGNAKLLEEVAKRAALEADRMRVLAEFLTTTYTYEQLLALEYQAMPKDRPEILYNVGSEKYERLEHLSVGQKCTAMLIVALSEGTMPIVIDQPEDSLDIRSIWDDICHKVRRGKERRQFIFTTHNSSVAVATDSDKFIIIEGEAAHGRVVFSGSMDHPPLSQEALKYLEGGSPTYRMKFKKYRGEDILRDTD